ncbi:MAG: hypothetical protein ACLR4X_07015 [Clostridia bacterium]
MYNVGFKPYMNVVSSYNLKDEKNYNFINKISRSESNNSFDKIITYKNRKGDSEYKRK